MNQNTFGANALRWSVSLALGVGMTSTAGVAFAQDADADEALTGRVEVTGSRIKRSDIEGALPVTVIDRNQIDLSGDISVGDLLRNTTFNSFGSFRPVSGSSAQGFTGVSLRGLGEGRTLILIDGRRAPLSPQTGSSQDVNAIPLAAVERVEILSDGASAIYGTDAIGGVVNIITRKDFTGVEMMYGMGETAPVGGDTEEGSVLVGASSNRGSVLGGASFSKRDIIFQRHHDWTTPGASVYGNNFTFLNGAFYNDPVNGSAVPGGCNIPGFRITGTGTGTRCVYDFTSSAAYEAATDVTSAFVRSTYQINDVWSTYLGAAITRVETFGRYAPVPAFAFVPSDSPNNPYGQDLYIAHRFAALGTRDNNTDGNTYDVNVGFQGTVGMFDLDVGMRRAETKIFDIGRNYLVVGLANQAIADGSYNLLDPLGTPTNILNGIKATIAREGTTTLDELYANATVDLPFELAGGVVGAAFGAEYRDEYYSDQYDSLSEAGQIGGSSGSSAGLGRDVTAMFFEVLLPVLPDLEVSIAGRHDKYSDYGSDFSPKISARWQAMDTLTLRASYGEGFAAPSLSLLSQSPSSSADSTNDQATCENNGLTYSNGTCFDSDGNATTPQVTMFVLANPDLGSEQSKQFSLGFAWDATEWLNMSLDYYNIEVQDRVSSVSLATMIACLAPGATTPCPPGVGALPTADYTPAFTGDPSLGLGIGRDPATGAILYGQRGFVNQGLIETDGVDFNARTNFVFGAWGTLASQLQVSMVNSLKIDGGINQVGYTLTTSPGFGQPKYRAALQNVWSYGDFNVAWNMSYIHSYLDGASSNSDPVGTSKTPSWTTHDLQVNYHAPWNGKMTLGVRNIQDKNPPLDQGAMLRDFDTALYNPYGRVTYIRYTQAF